MALSIVQIIDARAPQYSTFSRKSEYIDLSKLMTSTTAFGNRYEYAVALRVLHMIALENQRGGSDPDSSGTGQAGAINSESEGQLSRGFSVSGSLQSQFGDLSQTSYGLELIDIIRSSIFPARTRLMSNQEETSD